MGCARIFTDYKHLIKLYICYCMGWFITAEKNNLVAGYRFNLVFVAIGFLILSALHIMPYAFYQLTRLVVFCISVYFCYAAYNENNNINFWVIVFALIALIFNPIVKIYFSVPHWHWVDFLSATVFSLYWIMKNRKLLLLESKNRSHKNF